MKKLFKTAVCICCSFVLAFSCVFAASADGSAPTKYNGYMQQILDGLGNDDIIPINVIVFLRVGSDEIKAVREDFADRFIEEADKAAYFDRLDTGASMRYEYERASAETLDYLNSKDEEFFKAAAEALKISKEDIVFTGAIDWFNDVSKWGTDNIGSMCLKNLTKSKFLELSGSELVSGFFKETDGTVEDLGGKTGAEKDTCTYYFLAPADWCMKEYGAANDDVGCYWWKPEENAEWPGIGMTPAPEIGRSVYKITGVPKDTVSIVFNDHSVSAGTDYHYQTAMINTEGWAKGECPYDKELTADSFDGWIFVFDCGSTGEDWEHSGARHGAWFTVDDYRNHPDYYGTYTEFKELEDIPVISGDIDGDGKTTSSDALEILRMSADTGSASGDLISIADVDGDGTVTANDALAALRISIGYTD